MNNVIKHSRSGILAGAACLLMALGGCSKSDETRSAAKPVDEPPPTQEAPTAPPPTAPGAEAVHGADPTAAGEAAHGVDPTPAGAQPEAAADISDEELEKFAKAYLAIQALSPKYEDRLRQAKTPEEGNEIQREATDAIREEVEKHDMTFEQFTTVAMQVESNPALQQRIAEKLQGMQQQP